MDVLAGDRRRRIHGSEGLEQEVLTIGGKGGETRPEGTRQLVVVGVAVRGGWRLDRESEVQGTEPPLGEREPPARLSHAVARHGDHVRERAVRVDPRKRPHDRQERKLGRVLGVVPPEDRREVRDERSPNLHQQGVQRTRSPTLRITHQVDERFLIRPDVPGGSHTTPPAESLAAQDQYTSNTARQRRFWFRLGQERVSTPCQSGSPRQLTFARCRQSGR